jgi:hypothetical protein
MVEDRARKSALGLRVVGEEEDVSGDLVREYLVTISGRSPTTVEAYGRILRQLTSWIGERPGGGDEFRPELLTRTAVETYLSELGAQDYSENHRAKVKSAISGFARWLVEDKELLQRNPARGVEIPPRQQLAPRVLSPDQRYVLKNLFSGRAVFYTSELVNAPQKISRELGELLLGYNALISRALNAPAQKDPNFRYELVKRGTSAGYVEAIVVDEANRLKYQSREQLRDIHDRTGAALILIGMPGSRSTWHATCNSTPESASSTSIVLSRLRNCISYWSIGGGSWGSPSPPTTSPTSRRWPP